MSVLNQIQLVKHIDVRRVNREQVNELIQLGGHAFVQAAELFKVSANHRFLLGRLFQNTLRHNESSIFTLDADLGETVTNMHQRIGHEAEFGVVENLLLYAEHNAQVGFGTHFAQRSHELQIENDLAVAARCEIGQEFVDNDEVTLIGILFVERHHHVFNQFLVIADGGKIGDIVVDSTRVKVLLNETEQDFTQGHGNAADLNTQDFKFACDRLHCFCEFFVLQILQVGCVICDCGDDGHKVRFTGTVVTDNQYAFVIDDLIHLQLVNDRCLQVLCHRIGHDIGLYESCGLCCCPVGFLQLNSRFNRTKADQL